MYGKLFASLYQGTLRGRAHEILVFTNLLACADQDGIVDKHFRAIAEDVGITIDEVKAAIEQLEAPDPESRSPELGGARLERIEQHRVWGWRIVNYLKYRKIRNAEDRREQNRAAQARWRASRKPKSAEHNAQSAQPLQSAESAQAEAEAEGEAEAEAQTTKGAKAPARKRALDVGIPESLQTEQFTKVWKAWIDHRKAAKRPLTQQAAELQLTNLEAWGEQNAIEAIKQSILRGWQGIFNPNETNSRNHPGHNSRHETEAERRRNAASKHGDPVDPADQAWLTGPPLF